MADIDSDPLESDASGMLRSHPTWVDDLDLDAGTDSEAMDPTLRDMPALQHSALDWIRQNQTVAMIAGFALGVFVGALMRD